MLRRTAEAIRLEVPLGFEPKNRYEVSSVDDGFIFRLLVSGEDTFVRPLGKYIDSFLYERRHAKFPHAARGLLVETTAQRVEQVV